MKNNLVATLAILLLLGCNDSTPVADEKEDIVLNAPQTKNASLSDYQNLFKYNNLDTFAIDSFNWDTRIGKYKELDSTSFKLVWQDGKREFIGQGYDRDYLYSWQSRNPEFVEFTVLTQDESSYCDLLYYIIQNKEGKTIDKFLVATGCGDGGWSFQSSGRFISDSTYEAVAVEEEMVGFDQVDGSELIEGDSTITHFTIGKDGKVSEKEIFKTKISKKI
ncbi:hypothetical protein [Pontibacter roseus]|uniref:hypothetical protein n=1 Tax=Pontibacter roseus TaxID=336989 RepID=UPI00035EA03A|nr:hypothetical protein [Pontibacter roseus]